MLPPQRVAEPEGQLPIGELDQAVAEQGCEHGQRSPVHEENLRPGDQLVESGAVQGVAAEARLVAGQVHVRMRQRDEQQHQPTREVGGERPPGDGSGLVNGGRWSDGHG